MEKTFERPPTAEMILAARHRFMGSLNWFFASCFVWGLRAADGSSGTAVAFVAGFLLAWTLMRWRDYCNVRDRGASADRDAETPDGH